MLNKIDKQDIHSGYIVELRDTSCWLVTRAGNFTKILVDCQGKWVYFSCYKENLDHSSSNRNLDIVRVYGLQRDTNLYGNIFETLGREIVWERKEKKKMTISEIEEKLGFKIEIVSE